MLPDPTRIEPGARTPWAAEGVWSSWRGGRDRSRLFGWPVRGHRGEGRRGVVVLVLGLLGGARRGAARRGGGHPRRPPGRPRRGGPPGAVQRDPGGWGA